MTQNDPLTCQHSSPRWPGPKASPRHPNAVPGAPRHPNGAPRRPKESPRLPKEKQRNAMQAPKDALALYIHKNSRSTAPAATMLWTILITSIFSETLTLMYEMHADANFGESSTHRFHCEIIEVRDSPERDMRFPHTILQGSYQMGRVLGTSPSPSLPLLSPPPSPSPSPPPLRPPPPRPPSPTPAAPPPPAPLRVSFCSIYRFTGHQACWFFSISRFTGQTIRIWNPK